MAWRVIVNQEPKQLSQDQKSWKASAGENITKKTSLFFRVKSNTSVSGM